ncbi:MAG: alanine--tRNA ligase [Gemmatimonadales bacterium]
MLSSTIRQSFIDYFRDRGHTPVPSSPLIPEGDSTLLFTNAGMVQFKRVFQGLEQRDYRTAVTSQKCVRAGGKHNDLEQVGHTTRHHTFFEMLGNFSFGDYFKKKAIEYAWEWVTSDQYLGIHPDRLSVTVHHTDDDARKLWHSVTGLAESRIYGLGDEDNFWQMGDTGPCGPCSEIYVDLRPRPRVQGARGRGQGAGTQAEFEALAESGQLMEIWNLVFMQFDQAADGTRTPLPAPSVDTGAGLERIAAVLQESDSNFHTDLFVPLLDRVAELVGKPYDRGPKGAGYRVLADHARAVSFLLADGVYPANDGRGYVLRRILRRAVRHAWLLGRKEPTLTGVADAVVRQMGDVYPELVAKRAHILSVTQAEEERFLETIEGGLKRLDEITRGAPGTIGGAEAFKLYDTHGFPLDLTQLIAGERGWTVDTTGFEQALAQQQTRSRTSAHHAPRTTHAVSGGRWIKVTPRKRQKFVGYSELSVETEVLSYRGTGSAIELILQENPFYAESGGQISDTGIVHSASCVVRVNNVRREDGKQVLVGTIDGALETGHVTAIVDESRRRDIERNHSATHLVHAALRSALGTHVRQAGSVVAPDRLRFDFSHHQPVSDDALAEIEATVNQGIWANVDVVTREMAYDDALKLGAMALFGEKYGDRVRVVDMAGLSVELCGGTHVRTTGQIGLFHFSGESGVAAGVRRIEAVTGPGAYEVVRALDRQVETVSETLRTTPEHLTRKVEQLLEERRKLERQIEDLLRSGDGGRETGDVQHRFGDVILYVGDSPVSDREQVGLLMDAFRNEQQRAIKVLFSGGERPGVHVAVTDDLVSKGIRAGDLVKRLAAVSGGSGGGRPHFASGGIGDAAMIDETRRQAPSIIQGAIGA